MTQTGFFSTRTLTTAKGAALAEQVKVITQKARVGMEAVVQLRPVELGTVGYAHMLHPHRPILDQRHVNFKPIYSEVLFVLARPNIFYYFIFYFYNIFYLFRIWLNFWSRLASLSISPYLKNKTLTYGYFSP